VLPLVARSAAALTRWLALRFGEILRIYYDRGVVDALAAAHLEKVKYVNISNT